MELFFTRWKRFYGTVSSSSQAELIAPGEVD